MSGSKIIHTPSAGGKKICQMNIRWLVVNKIFRGFCSLKGRDKKTVMVVILLLQSKIGRMMKTRPFVWVAQVAHRFMTIVIRSVLWMTSTKHRVRRDSAARTGVDGRGQGNPPKKKKLG